MKTIFSIFAILVVMALGACATTFQMSFDKPGATAEQTKQDAAACNYDINSKSMTGGPLFPSEVARLMTMCMRGKGYTTGESK